MRLNIIFVLALFVLNGYTLSAISLFSEGEEDVIVSSAMTVDSVSMNFSAITLRVKQNARLILSVYPDNADNKDVVWSSSDETIATVNNGNIFASNEGTAIITATSAGKSATCTVTVVTNLVRLEEGTVTYSFGKYEGTLVDGIPDGQGTMYYTCRIQIARHGRTVYFAEKGDSFEGTWANGDIVNGNLFDSNKRAKAAIVAGRSPSLKNLSDDNCE